MATSWFVANLWQYSLQLTLVIALVSTLVVALRVRHPRARLKILQLELGAALVLPFITAWSLYTSPRPEGAASQVGEVSLATAVAARAPGSPVDSSWIHLIALAYGAGVASRLAWLVAGGRRLRRGQTIAAPPDVAGEVRGLQERLGTRARVEWRTDLDYPATIGMFPPRVLLPEALARDVPARRQAVVCHELLHVHRADWTHMVVEEAVRTALWFHPAVRWLIAELRVTREQVVDADVVAFTGERRPYLEVLYSFAASGSPWAQGSAVPFFGQRQLERRIRSLVMEVRMSRVRQVVATLGALGVSGSAGARWFPMALAAASPRAPEKASLAQDARRAGPPDGIAMPAVVAHTPIAYPQGLAGTPIDGLVTLRLLIDESGGVSDAKVVSVGARSMQEDQPAVSGADPKAIADAIHAMGESALVALRSWRFEPPAAAPLSFDLTVSFTQGGGTRGAGWTPLSRPGISDKLALSVGPTSETPVQASPNAGMPAPEVQLPKLIHEVRPDYPVDSKLAGIQGNIILEVTVATDGNVSEARVVRSIPQLDQAALDAVRQWRFSPGLKGGAPVPVAVMIQVSFGLK